jgi:hypothetical protein
MRKWINYINIWHLLLGLSFAVTFIFLGKTLIQLKTFSKFDKRTLAKANSWEIRELKDGTYVIGAVYQYNVKEKKIDGKGHFKKKKYINYYAALDELTKISKNDLQVWYSSKNIIESNLEKYFPLKSLMYALLSSSIGIYFYILKKKYKLEN